MPKPIIYRKCPYCNKDISTLQKETAFCPFCGHRFENARQRGVKARGNGQGSVRKDKSGYTAIATVGWHMSKSGKATPVRRMKSGFPTKKAALAAIPELLHKRSATKPQKLCSLWETFLSGHYLKLSTGKQYAYKKAWERIFELRNIDIQDLTLLQMQRVINSQNLSYYCASDVKNLYSTLYRLAIAQGIKTANLSHYVELPKHILTPRQTFSAEEIEKLWTASENGHKFAPYILLMIYTGMMPVEMRGLKWEHIDIEKQIIVGAGRKTSTRRKSPIVLADVLVPLIQRIKSQSQHDYVCPFDKRTFYSKYHAALSELSIQDKPAYSCRHTTATALTRIGLSTAIVQKVMRHGQISSTQKYIHPQIVDLINAVNKLKK